ncbi:rhodanese-like domain-containing protein [Acinetobacter sp. ANC 5383]
MYLPWGKVPEITCQELWENRRRVKIIDVRSVQEFQHSHIEGAVNLPITQFTESAIQSLGLKLDQPIVTICLSAHRSIPATRILNKMGYSATQLKGGMKSWWQQAMPSVTN